LAVESEWNRGVWEVMHDFEKLLSVKSPLKLMIYHRGRDTEELKEKIKRCLSGFSQHVTGERYIFCEFQKGWKCLCYVFTAKASRGRVKEVTFRTLFKANNPPHLA
jgi:hypothetical protein